MHFHKENTQKIVRNATIHRKIFNLKAEQLKILIFAYRVYNFDINPFPNEPWFLRICRTSLLKTLWGKEKLLVKSNFSIFLSVFYPFGYISAISITKENRRLQTLSVWKCLKFVVWKGLRNKLDLVHLKSCQI